MVRFIVDSTFGLSEEYAQKHRIGVVGLTVTIDGKEYEEREMKKWGLFFSDYALGKRIAKTSQPSPEAFMTEIDKALKEEGDDGIIILTIGDRLSGTVGSANVAKLQYPDKKIAVINTESASVAAKLMVDKLVEARDGGADFDGLIACAAELKPRLFMRFIPSSLTELARGGRVNKLVSTIGTVLNVKPVFDFVNNTITVAAKTIGLRRAVAAAVSKLPKFERLSVCYIHDDKNVSILNDALFRAFGLSHIDVFPVCPVLGAHIGVGTVGIGLIRT